MIRIGRRCVGEITLYEPGKLCQCGKKERKDKSIWLSVRAGLSIDFSSTFNQDWHKRGVFTLHTPHEFFMILTSLILPSLFPFLVCHPSLFPFHYWIEYYTISLSPYCSCLFQKANTHVCVSVAHPHWRLLRELRLNEFPFKLTNPCRFPSFWLTRREHVRGNVSMWLYSLTFY